MTPLRRVLVLVLMSGVAAGCEADPGWIGLGSDDSPPAPATARFDPANTGTIAGCVTWAGPIPTAPNFLFGTPKPDGTFETRMMPNPNRPAIDPASGAVVGAVVFLRGIDPAEAKPWNLPPVRVEWRDRQVAVREGDGPARRVGFVRRGDAVELSSAELLYHVLRGRGADFFSLTFPEPDRTVNRTLDRSGRVDLSSGAGFYWASADLFVCDHPYYALTGHDGRFTFEGVPAGAVEVVTWLPGWLPARQDRDPETGLITRMTYSAPTEATRPATVESGEATTTDITLP